MRYIQVKTEGDMDIPYLLSVHKLPEIARFIGINEEAYFRYVTTAENVFYLKAYRNETLAGTVHCEIVEGILYMSLLVAPEYQRQGVGTEILRDFQEGALGLPYTRIEVSIDKENAPSLGLFRKMGFVQTGEDEELLDFAWPA